MAAPGIKLITRADDCGSSRSANQAILETVTKGIAKNVSFMVPCAYFEEAAEMFRGVTGICFGLHATINAEWDNPRWGPLLPHIKVRSLVDQEGFFHRSTNTLHDTAASIDEIMAEVKAQLDKMRKFGLEPAYLDSHMYFEWTREGLREAMARFAQTEGLLYHMDYDRQLPEAGKTGDPAEQFMARLDAAEAGQFLYLGHPAFDDAEMQAHGSGGESGAHIAATRDWDRRVYTDPRVLDYFERKGVIPIRYDEAVRLG